MSTTQPNDRVCIVGGGPAGLATARALLLAGIEFHIFEKHSAVGGIWDPTNPGSPMYESAHFISSKTMSGYYDYPMPDDYPDYPSNKEILAYIRGFCEAYDLRKHLQFDTQIDEALYEKDRGWTLKTNHGTREGYRWLVAANGVTWYPKSPKFDGEETFTGKIMHSVNYQNRDQIAGKRVLIVGAGNSGVDIACDAASSAEQATISLRRGYHILPKHLFGMPVDVFGAQSEWMPLRIQQFTTAIMLRILLGDIRKLGLGKPDHRILESHPIINSQLLHYLQHGDLKAKPDIEKIEGEEVVFKDGTRAGFDIIILATGYDRRIPYLQDGAITYDKVQPKGFLQVFQPDHPELFINGFIETNGGAYKFFDQMAQMIAQGICTQIKGGSKWKKLQSIVQGKEPNLTGGVRYVDSDRHRGYTNAKAYNKAAKKFRKTMGWPELDPGMFDSLRSR